MPSQRAGLFQLLTCLSASRPICATARTRTRSCTWSGTRRSYWRSTLSTRLSWINETPRQEVQSHPWVVQRRSCELPSLPFISRSHPTTSLTMRSHFPKSCCRRLKRKSMRSQLPKFCCQCLKRKSPKLRQTPKSQRKKHGWPTQPSKHEEIVCACVCDEMLKPKIKILIPAQDDWC